MPQKKRFDLFSAFTLVFVLASLLLMQVKYWFCMSLIRHYAAALACAWVAIAMAHHGMGRERDEKAALAFAGWTVLASWIHGDHLLDASMYSLLLFNLPMLIAFPCARRMGSKAANAAAGFFFLVSGAMAVYSIGVTMTAGTVEWRMLQEYIGVSADYQRLQFSCHPNELAALFLVGIGLGLWLTLRTQKRWLCALLAVLGIVMYAGIGMTGSRTVMLQAALTGALIAAAVIMNTRMSLPKRLAASLGAGAVLFVLIYKGFEGSNLLVNSLSVQLAQAESLLESRPIGADIATLTGRTRIYKNAFAFLADKLRCIFIGTATEYELVNLLRQTLGAYHTHNAYLEALCYYGLPGLAFAVYFSVRALWAAWRVLPARRPLSDKLPAIMVLALLLGTITEPYLFSVNFPVMNAAFFLCLGLAIDAVKTPSQV